MLPKLTLEISAYQMFLKGQQGLPLATNQTLVQAFHQMGLMFSTHLTARETKIYM
jgi:hypothetical protein